MKEVNKKPIRADVIMARLNQIGVSASQASLEMGFSDAYLSMCFKRKWMPEYACRLIKSRFGIDYDEYKREEKKAPVEARQDDTLDLILEELRTIRAEIQSIREDLE